ncbi:trypsin-like peptidase domain-containing protein [Idiomarina loihiensis]|jgi:serine protease DegS|uniref:Periplasmic trypsin-like serine protease n=1 Tax=Idiomarina loihiensis (strain ATCC BAA-735 / DSM 15497 / L2-TR) TaxID=283942 RepID=Q5R0J4_IDILO|nr:MULTISPECIES: trypsin-like peptidase domain-containing protein [Idiomarina]NWO01691.1 trypsin-like peptidase domain-containing protein [Idiomarinaceae bacterium]AAV81253.1 Periplasmic trypsin-like serine protease [Idiomarina loihiensis L2TR]AGM35278.1 serine protease [Idiomarina loihiensis GSL 199]MAA61674.1 serine protease [Idiomarina sp.]MRJ45295.1 PDZ domain-containing protein [Idiomarina loihiensis]|tara:strand:+ start:8371 stop:9420 length:1050 start_codon:yes stop_codon:yes gene_type:complete
MQQLSSTLRFLLQSVGLGLVVAAIVIIAKPFWAQSESLRQNGNEITSFNQAVRKAAPAVVNIYSMGEIQGSYYQPQSSRVWRLGSGVIMDSQGYILTAHHVVDNVDKIEVALQDGRRYAAQLIGSDRYTDLAVLKIDAENLPVIPVQSTRRVRVGDIVLAIGNPYNIGQTITQGIVSASGGRVGVSNSYSDLIQMDAVINQGASGGALVNTAGELIGINNARYNSAFGDGGEGIYFAVPYENARKVMKTLIQEGKVVRGYIGISVNPNFSEEQSLSGILITGVERNSPAAKAGLQPNDFLVAIGGDPVRSAPEGLDRVAGSEPGTKLEVEFYRNEKRMTTTVTVAELPR